MHIEDSRAVFLWRHLDCSPLNSVQYGTMPFGLNVLQIALLSHVRHSLQEAAFK